jgi:hypothetical protein
MVALHIRVGCVVSQKPIRRTLQKETSPLKSPLGICQRQGADPRTRYLGDSITGKNYLGENILTSESCLRAYSRRIVLFKNLWEEQ